MSRQRFDIHIKLIPSRLVKRLLAAFVKEKEGAADSHISLFSCTGRRENELLATRYTRELATRGNAPGGPPCDSPGLHEGLLA